MKKIKTLIAINAALLICGFAAGFADAATYWAAPNGSDGNSCNSVSSASDPGRYRTANGVLSCLNAGDTAMYKAGIYDVRFTNPLPSGTSSSKTTMRGESRDGTIFRPTSDGYIILINRDRNNIRFQNFTIDGSAQGSAVTSGIRQGNGIHNNWEFIDLTIKYVGKNLVPNYCSNKTGQNAIILDRDGGGHVLRGLLLEKNGCIDSDGRGRGHGIYWRAHTSLIEYSRLIGNADIGIQLYSTDGQGVNDNILRYNVFEGNTHGLYFGTGSNNLAHNNLIVNNSRHGLRMRGWNNAAWNNTIYGNQTGIEFSSGSTSCELKNNLSVGNSSNKNGTCSTEQANITSGTATDYFTNANGGDFRLKAGSNGIDAGTAIKDITLDFTGTLVPQGCCYDIGAHEYKVTTVKPPVPPSNLQAVGQ